MDRQGDRRRGVLRAISRAKACTPAHHCRDATLDVDVSDYTEGDITDGDAVQRALHGCDAVVHSAALVATDPSETHQMLATNLDGAKNVLGGAVELGLDPIIHVSSFTAVAGLRRVDG